MEPPEINPLVVTSVFSIDGASFRIGPVTDERFIPLIKAGFDAWFSRGIGYLLVIDPPRQFHSWPGSAARDNAERAHHSRPAMRISRTGRRARPDPESRCRDGRSPAVVAWLLHIYSGGFSAP